MFIKPNFIKFSLFQVCLEWVRTAGEGSPHFLFQWYPVTSWHAACQEKGTIGNFSGDTCIINLIKSFYFYLSSFTKYVFIAVSVYVGQVSSPLWSWWHRDRKWEDISQQEKSLALPILIKTYRKSWTLHF